MSTSKWQLTVLLMARIVEPVGYTIIFPFINMMMEDLLPDAPKATIGRYSGAMESAFALASILFMYQWGKLSDRIGRKPVILAGLAGETFCFLMFGLSKSFGWALAVRALGGALCGNSSVMRAMLGEMTTKETEGWIYPLWTICWDLSCVIGPAIGALLQNPSTQYPSTWLGRLPFLRSYPYFLPCALVSGLSCLAWLLVLFCLKETNRRTDKTVEADETTRLITNKYPEYTFKQLISMPAVQMVLTSSFLLTLTALSFDAAFVLFAYSPLSLGGISLSPTSIALCLSIKGGLSIVFALFMFPRAKQKIGFRMLYRGFAACWIVIYSLPPVMNALAAGSGGAVWVSDGSLRRLWLLMGPLIILYVLGDLCFPLNMMALNATSPSHASLGALNAISIIVGALSRTLGPTLIGALYNLSTETKLPVVWVVFGGIALVSALQSVRLTGQSNDDKLTTDDV